MPLKNGMVSANRSLPEKMQHPVIVDYSGSKGYSVAIGRTVMRALTCTSMGNVIMIRFEVKQR